MKIFRNTLRNLIFLFLLVLSEISFLNHFSFWGVKPNLALIGLIFLFILRDYFVFFLGAFLIGIFYDILYLKFGLHFLVFLATASFLFFILRKYLFANHLVSALLFGLVGSFIFNFFFTVFSYLFFHQSFFGYFLSFYHLGELILNILGLIILIFLRFLFRLIFFQKDVS